jgi:nucleoside-diphosphate-sugar epimerase
MHITVLGANGRIGRQVVQQALAAGHEVSAVIRESSGSAAALAQLERVPPGAAGRLRVVVADPRKAPELAAAMVGSDAVLSGIGPRARKDPDRIASTATRAAIGAMRAAEVRRIVVVSAAPIGSPAGGSFVFRRIARPILRALVREVYTDLERMEAELRGSGLDWTAVRPPRLTDGPHTGTQKVLPGRLAPGFLVSRADVADTMLRALDDPATISTHVGVSA